MSKIYFISDLHLNHDRAFVYAVRGFESVDEMNEAIVFNWNSVVDEEDDVYIAGDVMLGDNAKGIEILQRLKGKIHIIIGNHDTDSRIELYNKLDNVVEVVYATKIKYQKYGFYISHYPTLVSNLDDSKFSMHTFNIFGHTHSTKKFYNDNPWMYNVACDAQGCRPVEIEDVISQCRRQYDECAMYL